MYNKRLSSPKKWPIMRKEHKFSYRCLPSAHPKDLSFPIGVVIRDILNFTRTNVETKWVLNKKHCQVNGIPVKSPSFAVGLFDVITFPRFPGASWIVELKKNGKMNIKKQEQVKTKIGKVIKKSTIKGGKILITTHEGWNFIMDKKTNCVPLDSVEYDLETRKPLKIHPFKVGSKIFLSGNKYANQEKTIKEIDRKNSVIHMDDGSATSLRNVYVIPNISHSQKTNSDIENKEVKNERI